MTKLDLTIGIQDPSRPKKYSDIRLNTEPPILGAPILFELMRGADVNSDDFYLGIGSVPVGVKNILDNRNLKNTTKYKGFYICPEDSFSFNRHSLKQSNPYVYLTESDIEYNAFNSEQQFCSLDDTLIIKNSISDYWRRLMLFDKLTREHLSKGEALYPDYFEINTDKYKGYYPNLHLIYAYLMENTKIVQIFERIITLYQNSEDLSIPSFFDNPPAINCRSWLDNTHLLFYSNSQYAAWDHSSSSLGSNFEAVRRNAYFRLFGLDLNHGIGEHNTNPVLFHKPSHFNGGFVEQFENFLKHCWQMIINYSNIASINTTDLIAIQEQANSLKHILLARRSTENDLQNYTRLNLSKVEFTSVIMMNWLYQAISYNSPIVIEMGAEGVTASERLNRLGQRVGIPAHSKSSNFIELASQMATLLRLLELDEVDFDYVSAIARPDTNAYALITGILYNYQLATGRDIKNQVMINGTMNRTLINR